jgi:hypothetical protein
LRSIAFVFLLGRIQIEQSEFEQILALGSEIWIFLYKSFDKLLGFGWDLYRILDFIFINLNQTEITFTTFYTTILFSSPSKGTLPVKS